MDGLPACHQPPQGCTASRECTSLPAQPAAHHTWLATHIEVVGASLHTRLHHRLTPVAEGTHGVDQNAAAPAVQRTQSNRCGLSSSYSTHYCHACRTACQPPTWPCAAGRQGLRRQPQRQRVGRRRRSGTWSGAPACFDPAPRWPMCLLAYKELMLGLTTARPCSPLAATAAPARSTAGTLCSAIAKRTLEAAGLKLLRHSLPSVAGRAEDDNVEGSC